MIPDLPEVVALLQASRLRQAWTAIKKFKSDSEAVKRKLEESAEDLDALLPAKELEGIADRFWIRYHVSYAPDLDPSERGFESAVQGVEGASSHGERRCPLACDDTSAQGNRRENKSSRRTLS